MPSPSKTKARLGYTVANLHRPSLGAVHLYQVVPAADPNHSPGSSVAPRLVPSTIPSAPSNNVACAKSSFTGRDA